MQTAAPIFRLSLALASLTTGITALAIALGLVPDRVGAVLEGRRALTEQLAVQCSLAVQRGDLGLARASLVALSQRHPELISAALRDAGGKVIIAVGEHELNWAAGADLPADGSHFQVPIAAGGRQWGQAEFRFRPAAGAMAWLPLHNPGLVLMAFLACFGFAAYAFYLNTFFRQVDVASNQVIPKRVRTTLNTLAEGVLILDKEDRIVMANDVFAQLTGESSDTLQGRKVSELPWVQAQEQAADEEYPWQRARGEGRAQRGSVLGLRGQDQEHSLSVNSMPILAEDGTTRGAFATFDDLTPLERKNTHLRKLLQRLKQSREEIRRQNDELRLLATHDPLTGCLNRRAFFTEFETQWASAQRYGHPLSCVMVDVDHFKSVNDNYGHGVGDQVLQLVADTLRSAVRKTDAVCRYGGEEFCVLLPHNDTEAGEQAADRLRVAIAARNCGDVKVTASLGVSSLALGARDPRELLEEADKCLYHAKRSGRNRVVRWDTIKGTPAAEGKHAATGAASPHTAGLTPIPFHAVAALLSALAYRHADTAAHSRRVADMCVAAAHDLMTQSECYVLEVAATLHDIGKLGVPDAVLLKPGPLTKEEWKIIRTHEGIGDEILDSAFSSPELTDIIKHHHCWYGGSPHDADLPVGEAIPLGARILSIADAYDAMVSDRVYRKGRTREEAFTELRRCAGVQFDPVQVERFILCVLARDEGRALSAVTVSKQTALKIGMQMEKLAAALDAQDHRSLASMAGYLNTTARSAGLTPVADLAAQLEQQASKHADPVEITQLTLELLDLCRATYRTYIPDASVEATK
jgi:diguanylate cyclase (GGDEF)-like protein/PAS domain S-box-containing protein